MTAIGKGDFVEALRSSRSGRIVAGRLYTCDGIAETSRQTCGDCGKHFRGLILIQIGPAFAYCPCAFKPISGGQPGMFDELLKAPTDAPTKEPVAA